MCPNRFYKKTEKGHMSIDTYNTVINQVALFAEAIQLYWMGEPLLNPNIIKFIEIAKLKTMAIITISTNGSLLIPEITDELLATGLDKIIIDIDANTPAVYSKIRSAGSFESLISNVEYILSRSKNTEVILQFLDFKINHSEQDQFIDRWQRENCKTRIDWIDTWANQMPELANLAHSISPYANEIRRPCADLWHKVTVNYLGDVNLCCHDYNPLYNFGNINRDNVIDLWNAAPLNNIRETHISKTYNGLCKDCVEWAMDEEYKELV